MSLDRLPHDRQLAKRLAKQGQAAAKARAQAELAHAKAVRRAERRRARARRRLPGQVGLGAGTALLAAADVGWDWLLVPVAVVAGVRALHSVSRLTAPAPAPVAVPAAAPPPPHPRSAAFPAVCRLEGVQRELARLLPLVSPAGREVGEEAWKAAGEADTALRWQAARLAAVEPHRGADPELLVPLHAGVERQEALVRAVADLVVASADPLGGSRLRDATDAVQGLAAGLRAVR